MATPPSKSSLAGLSPIKLAVLAQQMRTQSDALLRANPIAIVGIGCRFPGGADSPEAFWNILRDGRDVISPVPPGRWDVDASFDPDPAVPGKSAVREGGFIGAVDAFDAAFFGILPREAERMDPQQRLFLEVAIEALDDAGLPRERLAGSRAGVFVASYHNDYAFLEYSDREAIDARTLTGTVHSVLANRLSYALDLRGPSISIDTACSSSLVAIHLACQSLRHGESDLAIAGGVSLMITPDLMISLSKVGFMAPDGRSKTFDAHADGFGRGEGCGVVVLKRFADAVADGDRVLALVRGSAVNQDGHSSVLAAPNGLAQQALIREALENAQVEASSIGFIEAHGTGTALGDPIEVEALAVTVGVPMQGAGPCLMGAAKANIGHMEAAAGVGGVIKSVLMLRHGAIPPQVHFRKLSSHISLEGTRLQIPTELTPWPKGATPRRIGTSGFGVGGTNAHVIMEEAPQLPAAPVSDAQPGPLILPVSAQSASALRAYAQRWIEFLAVTNQPLAAVSAAAGERRSHYDHRLAVVGSTAGELTDRLRAFLSGDTAAGLAAGRSSASGAARLAFVFSGQGPQWFGMGRELAARDSVFRDVLADIDAKLKQYASWSLLAELAAPESSSRLNETQIAQPAIFAIQVALAALWKHWGFEPDAVVGHSVGEIAALHVAGALTLEDAVRVVYHRARIMQKATGLGAMAAVGLSEGEAQQLVREHGDALSIGAVNSPRGVVLSGKNEALAAALAMLDRRGVTHRALPVNYAFHSAQMRPLAAELVAAIGSVAARTPSVPIYSTVTGVLAAVSPVDAAYFGRNVQQPVRFAAALAAMLEDGFSVFLEIAPHPVLATSMAECASASAAECVILASLRRGRPERETMLHACAGLYASVRSPNWEALNGGAADPCDLPGYPWQRERYWLRERPQTAGSSATTGISAEPVANALLGARIPSAAVHLFQSSWPGSSARWLADHRVAGRLIVPAAAMLEALRLAACDALGSDDTALCEFVVHHPLMLGDDGEPAVSWQIAALEPVDSRVRVTLHEAVTAAAPGAGSHTQWRLIASAQGQRGTVSERAVTAAPLSSQPKSQQGFYAAFEALGVSFGEAFQTVEEATRTDSGVQAWLSCRDESGSGEMPGVHPTVIDGALQACVAAATSSSTRIGIDHGGDPSDLVPRELLLPIGADRYTVFKAAPGRLFVQATFSREHGKGSIAADLELRAPDGTLVALIEGVRFAPLTSQSLGSLARSDDWLYELAWHPAPARAQSTGVRQGSWILLADKSGVADALSAALISQGVRCLRVHAGEKLEHVSADVWTVDPANPAHLDAVLADSGSGIAGVVHLWSLDVTSIDRDDESLSPLAMLTDDVLTSGSALHVLQAMTRASLSSAQLALITAGAQAGGSAVPRAQAAGLWGFYNTVAAELSDFDCRVIDLDSDASQFDVPALAAELRTRQTMSRRLLMRGARRLVPVLQGLRPSAGEAVSMRLEPGETGTLDSLQWRPASASPPAADEVRIRVLAAGLNFRDVMVALGMYPGAGEVPLGAECAGVVDAAGSAVSDLKPGDLVFGFAQRSLASEVTAPAACFALLPDSLTVEQAAALPATYLTALYGLQHVAGIRAGMRVLIHAGAGGVGMAAIQIARRAGAEIFATAGSPAKRALLQSLGVAHVFDSRSLAFVQGVTGATGGRGVDIVLNSLSGDFIQASLDVLAPGGYFLELGKRDILTPAQFSSTRPDARYLAYDFGAVAAAQRQIVRPMLDEVIAGIEAGSLQPLPVRVFDFEAALDAFRFMAQARHIGKLVLRAPAKPDASRALVKADATYWITGGLGALGLRTARWLTQLGARNIVLTGRHAPDVEANSFIDECRALGARVEVMLADSADVAAMRAVLGRIERSMPRLRGVVHAAGALDDGILMQQDWKRWLGVLCGKAHGARVLHVITRRTALDFFVMYSAAGLLLGPAGQGAYASANAELDALAHHRRALGLPALSVAWGMWAGAGMAAHAVTRGADSWAGRGLGWIEPAQGFARLERLLRAGQAHAAVLPIDWQRFASKLPADADRTYFHSVAALAPRATAATAASDARAESRLTKWRAAPESERRSLVLDHVRDRALNVLGLDAATPVDPRTPLKEVGLDSLMAVELRNSLTRSIGQSLPATLLFDYPSLDLLASYLMKTFKLTPQPVPLQPEVSSAASVANVAALSEAEAEAQLLAELSAPAKRSAT